MATVVPTRTVISSDSNVELWTWALTTADTTGDPVSLPQYADLCWQATGSNWGGATAAVQGSNTTTDATFGAMTNASGGAAITYTADGAPKQSIERPLYVRPKLTTGGTSAVVSVTLLMRKAPQPRF